MPVAITVGVVLGALALAAIFLAPWGWLLIAIPAVLMAVVELHRGFLAGGKSLPIVPVVIGASAMLPAAYWGGTPALLVAFGLSVAAVIVWRALTGPLRTAVRDIGSGAFLLAYVPFLASFSALMLADPQGHWRVITFVLVTISSDIGGLAAGVKLGKHPMSPSVSPNKSWEGFAGSVAFCVVVAVLTFTLIFGAPWWGGVLFGAALAALATMGDLTESMLKRDLGIKDFGNLLPGHGGVMDRLDSLLVCAPAAWMLFGLLP